MRAGGVDWQLIVYGGAVHSFTNERASPDDLPRHRLRRGDRPPVLAGHARPVRRGLRLNGRTCRTAPSAFLTPRQVRATLDAHA